MTRFAVLFAAGVFLIPAAGCDTGSGGGPTTPSPAEQRRTDTRPDRQGVAQTRSRGRKRPGRLPIPTARRTTVEADSFPFAVRPVRIRVPAVRRRRRFGACREAPDRIAPQWVITRRFSKVNVLAPCGVATAGTNGRGGPTEVPAAAGRGLAVAGGGGPIEIMSLP